MKRKQAPIEMTPSRFAAVVGVDRHELIRKLEAMAARPVGEKNGGRLYALRDLVKATLGGDYEAERLRKTREEADRLALANARGRGETIPVGDVEKLFVHCFGRIRERILASPLPAAAQDGILHDLKKLGDDLGKI